MDLNELKPQRNTVVTKLKHPLTGEPLKHNKKDMWVERYLPHTKEYKKLKYALTQKYMKKAQESGDSEVDLLEIEQDNISLMAETTVAWQVFYDGEWIEFTPEKAQKLYEEAFWIAEQLQEQENSADVFTKV